MTFELRAACARAGPKVLVPPVDAVLQPGRVTVIAGPNGAGKSTLLSLLTGQRVADEGAVLLDGVEVRRSPAAVLATRRAAMAQESSVAFDFTAAEVVELGRYPHRRRPGADESAIVREAMEVTGVAHLAQRTFATLSGGEKARVHLARALAQVWEPLPGGEARWMLLDEPTAALDLAHQHAVLRLVRAWAHDRGVGAVVVLHDINLALRYADDALVLGSAHGPLIGPVAKALTAERIEEVWQVSCARVEGGSGGAPQFVFG
ncbi:heme ABC transporter ATP-binding protein [Ramlibacter sp.]|uniref:heme ABC transporter ATP-binding protein n=1 Tax=Ramlibacter sp. TaxID=1917967 RepID=UPI003D0BC8F1